MVSNGMELTSGSDQFASNFPADDIGHKFERLDSRGSDAQLRVASMTGHSLPSDFAGLHLVGDSGSGFIPNESTKKSGSHAHPPRLDHFNATVTPADHFRWFDNGKVSASGRVHVGVDQDTADQRKADGEKNLLGLVELMHPDLKKKFDATNATPEMQDQALRNVARNTAVVELRTLGDAKLTGNVLKSNDDEMNAELQASKDLGIDHVNFPMNSHDLQPPAFIAKVVDYIHNEVTSGKAVDIHCYHGTDRTGLIGQSEFATYDPAMQKLLKDPGQAGFDKAYAQSIESLLRSGVDPGDHTEIYESMKQYLQYLHDPSVQMKFDQVPISNDQSQKDALRDAAAKLTADATMDSYMVVLRENVGKFDPATHSEFYGQLYHKFNSIYVKTH